MNKKKTFTLAEVLITLAIVGVVAAMTIPTLVARINDKVTENQNKVFQAKLIKALNLTKTAGLLNNTYTSTEDFLRRGLATHYKMSSICGKDDLRSCVPYDKIYFGENNESVNVADLKTPSSIKINKDGFEDTAAFVTADGIPVIVSYKKDCLVDTEMLDKGISSCLAGIYDLNGSKLPNKYGVQLNDDGETIKAYTNDIHSFNGAGVGSSNPKINGVEIVVKAFDTFDPAIYSDPAVGTPQYPARGCSSNFDPDKCLDAWSVAQKWCEKNGAALPSSGQLAKIAQTLYDDTSIIDKGIKTGLNWDKNKTVVLDALGIDISEYTEFEIWTDEVYDDDTAFYQGFASNSTRFEFYKRNNSGIYGICVK